MGNSFKVIKVTRQCPLCGSCQAHFLHEMKYAETGDPFLPSQYKIVCCANCHFLFNDFSGDSDGFRKHYRQILKYANPSLSGGGGSSVSEEQIWQSCFSMLKKYIPDQTIAVLDLGCGKGGFLKYFKKQGYSNLFGVDYSEPCIRNLQQYGIDGMSGDGRNLLPEKQFDLILSTGVFEHLVDPCNVLQMICSHLKPGGFICLVVPDANKYKCSTEAPYYYFDREHINHFDRHSLSLLGRLFSLTSILIHSCGFPLVNGTRIQYDLVAIFQKKKENAIPKPMIKYLNDSKKQWEAMALPILDQYENVFLWGIGAYAENLLVSDFFRNVSNLHLLDVDLSKQGKVINGIKISDPSLLLTYNHPHSAVLITSVLYEKEIIAQLKKMNWRGMIHNVVRK